MSVINYFKNYIDLISNIVKDSNLEHLDLFFQEMKNCFDTEGRIFLAGNGGSAAIANHAVTDLSKLEKSGKYLTPISLASNIPQITANSNDDGYENFFVLGIKNFYINEKDLVVSISSSGNSKNILNLINYSNEKKAKTFSLLGFDGGKAKPISKFPILLDSKKGYYGPVEDIHMMIFHYFAHIIKKDIGEINE